MEDMEPSAIGVRADFDPPVNQGNMNTKNSKNQEDNSFATPHAMLFAGYPLGTGLMVHVYRIDSTFQPDQWVSTTIYRPPLAAR